MAAKKMTKKAPASAKATAGKPAKKAVAKKAPAKKAPASAKATAGKPAKKKAAKKAVVSQKQFDHMVNEAAYFAAQNDGNSKDSATYWVEANAAISKKFSVQ